MRTSHLKLLQFVSYFCIDPGESLLRRFCDQKILLPKRCIPHSSKHYLSTSCLWIYNPAGLYSYLDFNVLAYKPVLKWKLWGFKRFSCCLLISDSINFFSPHLNSLGSSCLWRLQKKKKERSWERRYLLNFNFILFGVLHIYSVVKNVFQDYLRTVISPKSSVEIH